MLSQGKTSIKASFEVVPHDEECRLKEYGLTLGAGVLSGGALLSGAITMTESPIELVTNERTDCGANDITA